MKNVALVGLTLVLFTAAAACEMLGANPVDRSTQQQDLVGPTWRLTAFVTASDSTLGTGSVPLSVTFRPDSLVVLRSLNRADGPYTLGPNNALHIDLEGSTYVGEPEGSKTNHLWKALERATSYEIEGDQLRIFYGDGMTLRFVAKESND